jgi:hypothetical protein
MEAGLMSPASLTVMSKIEEGYGIQRGLRTKIIWMAR